MRNSYRSTGHGAVGHQMGLKSSQMGGIVCVAWIRFLGILGMWKEDRDWLQERDVYCTQEYSISFVRVLNFCSDPIFAFYQLLQRV